MVCLSHESNSYVSCLFRSPKDVLGCYFQFEGQEQILAGCLSGLSQILYQDLTAMEHMQICDRPRCNDDKNKGKRREIVGVTDLRMPLLNSLRCPQ